MIANKLIALNLTILWLLSSPAMAENDALKACATKFVGTIQSLETLPQLVKSILVDNAADFQDAIRTCELGGCESLVLTEIEVEGYGVVKIALSSKQTSASFMGKLGSKPGTLTIPVNMASTAKLESDSSNASDNGLSPMSSAPLGINLTTIPDFRPQEITLPTSEAPSSRVEISELNESPQSLADESANDFEENSEAQTSAYNERKRKFQQIGEIVKGYLQSNRILREVDKTRMIDDFQKLIDRKLTLKWNDFVHGLAHVFGMSENDIKSELGISFTTSWPRLSRFEILVFELESLVKRKLTKSDTTSSETPGQAFLRKLFFPNPNQPIDKELFLTFQTLSETEDYNLILKRILEAVDSFNESFSITTNKDIDNLRIDYLRNIRAGLSLVLMAIVSEGIRNNSVSDFLDSNENFNDFFDVSTLKAFLHDGLNSRIKLVSTTSQLGYGMIEEVIHYSRTKLDRLWTEHKSFRASRLQVLYDTVKQSAKFFNKTISETEIELDIENSNGTDIFERELQVRILLSLGKAINIEGFELFERILMGRLITSKRNIPILGIPFLELLSGLLSRNVMEEIATMDVNEDPKNDLIQRIKTLKELTKSSIASGEDLKQKDLDEVLSLYRASVQETYDHVTSTGRINKGTFIANALELAFENHPIALSIVKSSPEYWASSFMPTVSRERGASTAQIPTKIAFSRLMFNAFTGIVSAKMTGDE